MKKIFKPLMVVCSLVIASATFTSCDNDKTNDVIRADDEIVKDKDKYKIIVNPTNGDSTERHLKVNAQPGSLVSVNAKFTGDKNMYRLYITKTIITNTGTKTSDFEYPLGKKKKDGSIDLPRQDKKEFTYAFSFDAPANNNEIVQYKLWVTSARGDYRDPANSNAISKEPAAYGTVTIVGDKNAVTNKTAVKSFSGFFLKAPLGDESSETFISIIDGKKYKINEASETVKLWDFGYYYGETNKASFVSIATYPSNVIDVKKLAGTYASELNHFYFRKSSKTATDFAAVSKNEDLNFINGITTERVTNLVKGTIVEFIDGYGNKGLLKITGITEGNGSLGKITFDIKVQVKAEPIKG